MRLAVTADLHWGLGERGDGATRELAARVRALTPEVLVLAGDIGEGVEFRRCLALFSRLDCVRLLVPGNHDLWSRDPTLSSLEIYERRLPELAREEGFQFLDAAPYLHRGGREAIAGSINWYD